MLRFFSDNGVTSFANEIAENLAKRYPVAVAADASRTISVARLTSILESELERASNFSRDKNLTAFQKAKFANTLRWKLDELGYKPEFVEMATEALVIYTTVKSPKNKTV